MLSFDIFFQFPSGTPRRETHLRSEIYSSRDILREELEPQILTICSFECDMLSFHKLTSGPVLLG